jgi:hypothetical protein
MLLFIPRSLCALNRVAAKSEHHRFGATQGIRIAVAAGLYRAEATDGRRAVVVQARHSSYSLTSRYTHSRFYDLAAAVESLPIPVSPSPAREPAVLAATGTDGKAGENAPTNLVPFLVPQAAVSGVFERRIETEKATGDIGRLQQKTLAKREFSRVPSGSDNGMSKMEPRGIEPLTSALRTLRSPS